MKLAFALGAGVCGLFLGMTGALHAVPPPPEQYTADCQRPVYASDQLVCQTAELKALDTALAAQIVATTLSTESRFAEGHGQWFRRRSLCAMQPDHLSCLRAAYSDRSRLLERNGQPLPSVDKKFICRSANNGTKLQLSFTRPDEVLIANEAGLVIGLASKAKTVSGWRPFLTFEKKRSSLILNDAQNVSTSCKLTRPKS